ncbi:MAG: DUF5675 family protein, partial [Prevotellaceae bacterium]|jgi:hypothetical protein|nr:DUF5675 family protein [Prevotellaceae bacterium]
VENSLKTNPAIAGAISIGKIVAKIVWEKLLNNKDDLVGFWQVSLNRTEHYPHGILDKQDIPDTTQNILVDYTLFGFEKVVQGSKIQESLETVDAAVNDFAQTLSDSLVRSVDGLVPATGDDDRREDLQLQLIRKYRGAEYTIGALHINGEYFCDTLEDTDRGLKQSMPLPEIESLKIPKLTAIPEGEYDITIDETSPKYSTRSAYKFCEGKVPRLLNVPGFDGILIHIGNYAIDTEGCILVGDNTVKGQVRNSTVTFQRLYAILKTATKITLTVNSE